MISGAFAAGAAALPAQAATGTGTGSSGITVARACAAPTRPGELACLALKRTDVHEGALISPALPSGYGPSDLASAYNLPSGGSGQTVAIVDAQDDPNAESDLATYRSTYGLPACTTANGCFRKINQNGGTSYPSPDSGWAGEISLDVDMVSAVCPNCHILLVEATSASDANLGTAVNQAVAQGAKFVSNSYGGNEDSSVASSDAAYFNHPGVAITVSTGDSNTGAEYPATSQYVTAVGGTSLTRSSSARGWNETVWRTNSTEGGGSGCSAYITKPSWQHDTGCSRRMEADVAAVADPATGVSVYQTYGGSGWAVYGGTSAASPIVASVWALAGAPNAGDRAAQYPYNHTGSFNDVTSGSNGSCSVSYFCNAGPGYDGPTGWGSPNGTSGFGSGSTGGSETVTVTNPGSRTGTVGTAVSLQISGTDSASKPLTYSATGLPAGLAISSSGLITGTPSAAGTSTVTVSASSGTASGSTAFSWTISSSGGGGGGTGCAGLSAWSATSSYVPGDRVSYNSHQWLSAWYSTGATPGAPASWAVWTDQGAC
ncbi:hypothetical protein ACEZDB_09880 [Streptacidiphilus sp. N1-3]|uniref:Peptidase S53 domain-containing protein n=1 Tax=Streptacidiphilus alkalitolerans TaxID=3342712 RepID=A0ABV6WZD9_9ACTN